MLSTTELNVRTLELNRRVAQANRYGWLFSSTRRDRQTTKFDALLGVLLPPLHRNRSAGTVGTTGADGATSIAAMCR